MVKTINSRKRKGLSKAFHFANAINILSNMNEMTDEELKKAFNKVLEMKKRKKEGRYF